MGKYFKLKKILSIEHLQCRYFWKSVISKWNILQKHRIDISFCKFRVYWVSVNTKIHNITHISQYILHWIPLIHPGLELNTRPLHGSHSPGCGLDAVFVRTFRTSRRAKILPLMTSENCRQVVTVFEREMKCEYTSMIGKDHCYTYCIRNKHILKHCFCSSYLSNKYLPK